METKIMRPLDLKKFTRLVLVIASCLLLVTMVTLLKFHPLRGGANSDYFKLIDASCVGGVSLCQNISYAYAPAIVQENNQYHMFFCSQDSGDAWDNILYSSSTNGVQWSIPVVKIRAMALAEQDMTACDPSVVYSQGYYYIYYTSAYKTGTDSSGTTVYQRGIQVARSQIIDGDYEIYTSANLWETPEIMSVLKHQPKVIVKPLHVHTTNPAGYGAGQPSVLARDGLLYMWYTDDSASADFVPKTYLLTSNNPVLWNVGESNVTNLFWRDSSEIGFDDSQNKFVMYGVDSSHTSNSALVAATSSNGQTWDAFSTTVPAPLWPDFSHNAGFSRDRNGSIITGQNVLLGFGVPADLQNTNSESSWDLYGVFVARAANNLAQ